MQNLYTVAHIAVQYQQPFHIMQKALGLIQAEPELALNNVPYFTLDDERAELLREYFETRRANTERNKGAAWTPSLPIPNAPAVPEQAADGSQCESEAQ